LLSAHLQVEERDALGRPLTEEEQAAVLFAGLQYGA
jgi:hypothetical protein